MANAEGRLIDAGLGIDSRVGEEVASDLLAAGALVLLALSLYLPLFFFNVAWFLPLALLPRGVLSEMLTRSLLARKRWVDQGGGLQAPPAARRKLWTCPLDQPRHVSDLGHIAR